MILLLFAIATCASAQVPEAPATAPAPQVLPPTTAPAGSVFVPVSHSVVVTAPWPVRRVSVTDPKIADVQVLTPTEVMVSGKVIGGTDLLLWDQQEHLQQMQVVVGIDRVALREELSRLVPGEQIAVRQSGEVVVITGKLRHAEDAQQLHKYMDATGIKYVDLTTLPGVQQVQLRVMLAEASRNAIRALGINGFITGNSAFGGLTLGTAGGGPLAPVDIGVPSGTTAAHGIPFQFNSQVSVPPSATLFAGFPGKDFEIFVQALEDNQYVRVLAEPTLVALSGQEASFLAGGEIPIPVVQGGTGGGSTSISIEFKEFGIRLLFRPTVLGDGAIRLHVLPEVSQLSSGPGSVQIQGFSIPAIMTRRAETTLELHSGQTFAIAGLISQTDTAEKAIIPVLGNLPVLGPLFRSVRYESGDTELVVMVTASLVEPSSEVATPLVPGGLHRRPNDWELYIRGHIEGETPAKLAAPDSQQFRQLGLDQLKGPGAWVNYDSGAATSEASLAPAAGGPSGAGGAKAPAARP